MSLSKVNINLGSKMDFNSFDIRKCDKCKLCQTRKNVVVPQIVENCQVLLIGEAPGQEEDMYGIPFVGQAGQLLNQVLQEVGIDRNECSILNVTQCKTPNGREPDKDEIDACRDIVDYYINKANPKIIVPIGNVALKRIAKHSGITKYNGNCLEHPLYPGRKIIPVVHPAFVLRDPRNITTLRHGLERVKLAMGGEQLEKLSNVTYVDNYEKFDLMIKDLSSQKQFAVDIETSTGRDWNKGYIICISFSNKKGTSYVLPWIIGDDKYYEFCKTFVASTKKRDPITDIHKFCFDNKLNHPAYKWSGTDVEVRLRDLLGDESITKILHNYSFDYKYLEAKGLLIKGTIYDTIIMHHQLDERQGSHGLKDCAMVYTTYGQYDKKLDDMLLSRKNKDTNQTIKDSYALIPLEVLVPYAGTDSDVTLTIFEVFLPKLIEEGLFNLYHGFLFPLSKMLMDTEKNGITIDVDLSYKYEKVLEEYITNLDYKLNEFTKDFVNDPENKPNVKGVNFRSPQQLRKFMFDHLKLPIIKYTDEEKQTNPSTDEEVLAELSKCSDFCKYLLDRRKKDKVLCTYVRGIRNVIWEDGKVHPNFYIYGTVTGRLSSRDPNGQNLPRNSLPGDGLYELGVNVKNLFICAPIFEDDYVIVETDYSQAELRLIAEYSRDENLYNAFMAGRDPHAELAVRIYHKDKIALMESGVDAKTLVTPEERQKAKTANFALCYGKGAENFGEENGIPYSEAYKIHRVYWETYPGILIWKDEELSQARKSRFFQTKFGRKRRLENIVSSNKYLAGAAEREGINFIIQSQASDITLWSAMKVLGKCKDLKLDAKTISFVHDSSVYLVKKTDLQQFLTILRETMLHPPGISIPMESEVKVGNRLGSLKEWVCIDNIWKEKVKKVV